MNNPVDHTSIFAAIIAWNGMMTAAIVWLANELKRERKRNTALERELAPHRANTEKIRDCPQPECPWLSLIIIGLCLCLVSCAPKTAEARHYDKSILIVVKTEQPASSAVGSMIKPLLNLLIP
jgi:hypothetical protein